ncbi:hypothetical protein B0H19DRAFT_1380084 [Mycena capillaripes]|nr:hypothetical protein B0H19DRAFT_1380084 [Mycena capillaripes]
MHAALGIPDLVDLVVSELHPLWEARALAALACTSKIFHEAALDALWRYQNSGIMNLIRCMPGDLWESIEDGDGNVILKPCRTVVASDWERVLKYAHRVKSLHCESLSDTELLPVYDVLEQYFLGDYLLPDLECLEWEHWDSAYSPFIQLFLGPRVTSITLGTMDDGPCPALAMVRQTCPGLTSLVVDAVREGSEDSEHRELSQLVRALTRVESLELQTIDSEALRYLGHLPTLKNLCFTFHHSVAFDDVPDSSMFSGLCKVICYCNGAIAPLLAFLRTWNNPHLNSFYAFIYDCRGSEEIEQLYQLLASHCVHDHLVKLKLQILRHGIVYRPNHIFHHLFCFTRLTLVEIRVPVGYDISDATISDMARAWPNIEQLSLGWSPEYYYHTQRCTLLALVSFARHCPRLREVSIPLDFSSVPVPVDGVVQETLWRLGWSLTAQLTPAHPNLSRSF